MIAPRSSREALDCPLRKVYMVSIFIAGMLILVALLDTAGDRPTLMEVGPCNHLE
jgi:hypothetical protein